MSTTSMGMFTAEELCNSKGVSLKKHLKRKNKENREWVKWNIAILREKKQELDNQIKKLRELLKNNTSGK